MAEKIICEASDLTAIADAVRASTGGTDTFTVPELSAAAVSVIGEDVTAETTEYTELLTDLEAAVDALPDAGSGSGGSVETCTVTCTLNSEFSYASGIELDYTTIKDGELTHEYETITPGDSVQIVVPCGALMALITDGQSGSFVYNGLTVDDSWSEAYGIYLFSANHGATTASCTYTIQV